MQKLNNNIRSMIFEIDLSNIFSNKKQFDDNVEHFSNLINDLISYNKNLFTSSGKNSGAFGSYDISGFSKNIDKAISELRNGNISYLNNDNISKIYNKLIESGIDKNKLNDMMIELLNDIKNIKNINEIEVILKTKTLEAISKFRDKLSDIQYKEIEELKKSISSETNLGNSGLLIGGGILVLSLFGLVLYSLFKKKT